MKYVRSLAVVLTVVPALLAGCARPAGPMLSSFRASSTKLPSAGGSDALSWTGTGASAYHLSVSPSANVTVGGKAYSGAVDLGTSTGADVTLPGNSTGTNDTYTFTLSAGAGSGVPAATKSVSVTVAAVMPKILMVDVTPAVGNSGTLFTVQWQTQFATSASLDISPGTGVVVNGAPYSSGMAVPTSGSVNVQPPPNTSSNNITYSFVLMAANDSGKVKGTGKAVVDAGP